MAAAATASCPMLMWMGPWTQSALLRSITLFSNAFIRKIWNSILAERSAGSFAMSSSVDSTNRQSISTFSFFCFI